MRTQGSRFGLGSIGLRPRSDGLPLPARVSRKVLNLQVLSKKWSSPRRSARRHCKPCPSPSPRRAPNRSATTAPPTSWISRATSRASRSRSSGPGQSQVGRPRDQLRPGIRDQPGVKEQVGVYLDESPISVALFTPDLELADLRARFEVLRGPQGTLFGAGSEAGYTLAHHADNRCSANTGDPLKSRRSALPGRRLRRQLARRREPSDGRDRRPATSSATTTSCRDSSTRSSPTCSVKEDVNDGDRTGGRGSDAHPTLRRAVDHTAHRLSEAGNQRLSARRSLQHPRESLHDDAAARDHRRPAAVHADPRRHRRRLHARRPQHHATTSGRSR